MYHHLEFLQKLINDILPALDREIDTREGKDAVFKR